MGEPFVEGQLRLKMESAAARTFVAHHSNGFLGYIPTPEALERGGYEIDVHTSMLAGVALDTIVDSSVQVLDALFA